MNNKTLILPIIVFILLAAVGAVWMLSKNEVQKPIVTNFEECVTAGYPVMESYPRKCKTPDDKTHTEEIPVKITYVNASDNLIKITTPLPGAIVGKDFSVTGKARGTWFFEASFPVEVLDKDGNSLTTVVAQAQSDWMTEDFVPFKADVKIPESYKGKVTLVLKKDNPSGLPEHDASVSFPIIIEQNIEQKTTSIELYYYNPALDQGPGGVQCSKNGLVKVNRTISQTITPLTESIKLLLRGEILSAEKTQGITSEFPLAGVSLTSASIQNGIATLTFSDPQNKTGGGSCRVAILKAQIEATAKQFSTVNSVRFMPAELFQP